MTYGALWSRGVASSWSSTAYILSLSMAAEWESENLAAILHRTTEMFVDANLPGVSAVVVLDLSFKSFEQFSQMIHFPLSFLSATLCPISDIG